MSFVGRLLIPAPHGHLEAIYRPSSDPVDRVALVLHPHPLYGGTMHNKVVFHAAKALEEVGFETLRFNFRGVGASTGAFDYGRGEVDDARVALDYALARRPHARRVWMAGFSFGAGVALHFGCADARVQQLIVIGTPARAIDRALLLTCRTPIAFIHGAADEVAPLAELEQLVGSAAGHVIPGADHFFEEHLDALRAAIRQLV